jgi:hypothetical protein
MTIPFHKSARTRARVRVDTIPSQPKFKKSRGVVPFFRPYPLSHTRVDGIGDESETALFAQF